MSLLAKNFCKSHMDIPIPKTNRRRALVIIDVQPMTLSLVTLELIPYMVQLIEQMPYDAYVEATAFCDENSMFYKQNKRLKTREETGPTDDGIKRALKAQSKPLLSVEKTTRSCFKSLNAVELTEFLKTNAIEELHFIGYDINDCVLASAFDSIDLGFHTYVIEELCHHWNAIPELRQSAITVLRRQNMTNHSVDV